jgi:hypothetical protein
MGVRSFSLRTNICSRAEKSELIKHVINIIELVDANQKYKAKIVLFRELAHGMH